MSDTIIYRRETEVDGLAVSLRCHRSADQDGTRIGFVEVLHRPSGAWLATVFRLGSASFGFAVRLNCRQLPALLPRQALLIDAAERFRDDVRDGKAEACTE